MGRNGLSADYCVMNDFVLANREGLYLKLSSIDRAIQTCMHDLLGPPSTCLRHFL
jgi:hypothetical protein